HAILCGGERRDGRADLRALRQCFKRVDRDVFPVEREHFAVARESCKVLRVRELALDLRRDLARRCVLGRIEEQEIEAQRIARQCEHAAELAGADDADGHERGTVLRGSGFFSTFAVCCSRNASSAAAMAGCLLPRIAAALSAALVAPAAPMANVAT